MLASKTNGIWYPFFPIFSKVLVVKNVKSHARDTFAINCGPILIKFSKVVLLGVVL